MKKRLLLLVGLFLTMSFSLFSQQKVTGKVTADADGQPLPGVSVVVKGTKTGTITDVDGNFALSADPIGILVFSFIGFAGQDVSLAGRSTIDVSLKEDNSVLNEVVVTGLGITREQRALGYASTTIKADELVQAAPTNFAAALYGKAPGVRISSTPGGATSATNIQIRGVNSITGKSQPLIVMDGVPIRDGEATNNDYWGDQRLRGNGLLDINPENIESISILKGASAAALYGSEAVNGVVLITTKSGKGQKGLGIDFSANYGVEDVAFLPRYQNVRGGGFPLNYVNAGQDASGFVSYNINGVKTRGILQATVNFGPKFDGQPVMSWDGIMRPYEAQTDGYSNFYQQGQNSNINLAVSQGNENGNIRFSFTRQDNQMLSRGANNNKNIATLNSSFKLGSKITTNLSVNYTNQLTHNRPYSIDRMINNFTGMIGRFDNAAWYQNKYKTSKGYRYAIGAATPSLTPEENIIYNGHKNDILDYTWRINENNLDEYSNRVLANLTNTWEIVEGLSLQGRISTDFTSERIEARNSTEAPLAINPNTGGFSLDNNLYSLVYGDVLLSYRRNITPDLDFKIMGGYTASRELNTKLGRSTNNGLSTENLFDLAASNNLPNSGSSRQVLVKDALLGTINFGYKRFLYAEGTIRQDRTSTMNPNNNTFVYPSVNAGFIFSDAFQMPKFISYGKLRGAWGVVGNFPDIYRANIAYNQGSLGIQQTGGRSVLFTTVPGAFGNDLIRPEQKREFEFGLETKFFNNRVGLELSYYNGQIVDQILPLTLAPTSGASSVFTNIGTLRNKGIEFLLTTTPIKTKNFSWDFDINYSKNSQVVEKLANGSTELLHADYDGNAAQLRSVVGQPMGDIYAHPVARHSNGQKLVVNGIYKLDDKWEKYGNAMPTAVGGLTNTFNYKGINLTVLTDYRIGGHIMPTGVYWLMSRGLLEESLTGMDAERGGLRYYETTVGGARVGVPTTGDKGPNGEVVYNDGILVDGVTTTGEKNTNIISQAVFYNSTYNWGGPQYSNSRYELYINKNTFFKLREVSLGYRLPASVVKKMNMKSLMVSVYGRNLLYFYRTIKDIDAEQTTAGSRWTQNVNNAGGNPSSRSMGVMVRASF
jgi:iron complex outermembrane recepter protein